MIILSAELDNVLNNFLKVEGFDCKVVLENDFGYYESSNTIAYSITVSERMSNLFLNFVKSLNFNIDCGYFILAFFHELGHNETLHLFEEEEIEKCNKIKETLSIDKDEDCKTYFNLPVEIIATKWAIDYISNNLQKVQKLAEDFQKEFLSFLKKYEIE